MTSRNLAVAAQEYMTSSYLTLRCALIYHTAVNGRRGEYTARAVAWWGLSSLLAVLSLVEQLPAVCEGCKGTSRFQGRPCAMCTKTLTCALHLTKDMEMPKCSG